MQYTIKEQVSLSLLDSKFHTCDQTHATYQFEVYYTNKHQKIGMLNHFNNNQFTHPINSRVNFIPSFTINGVLISEKQMIKNVASKAQENQK